MNTKQCSLLYIFTHREVVDVSDQTIKILTNNCKTSSLNQLFAVFTTADERNGSVLYLNVYFICIMKMNVLL